MFVAYLFLVQLFFNIFLSLLQARMSSETFMQSEKAYVADLRKKLSQYGNRNRTQYRKVLSTNNRNNRKSNQDTIENMNEANDTICRIQNFEENVSSSYSANIDDCSHEPTLNERSQKMKVIPCDDPVEMKINCDFEVNESRDQDSLNENSLEISKKTIYTKFFEADMETETNKYFTCSENYEIVSIHKLNRSYSRAVPDIQSLSSWDVFRSTPKDMIDSSWNIPNELLHNNDDNNMDIHFFDCDKHQIDRDSALCTTLPAMNSVCKKIFQCSLIDKDDENYETEPIPEKKSNSSKLQNRISLLKCKKQNDDEYLMEQFNCKQSKNLNQVKQNEYLSSGQLHNVSSLQYQGTAQISNTLDLIFSNEASDEQFNLAKIKKHSECNSNVAVLLNDDEISTVVARSVIAKLTDLFSDSNEKEIKQYTEIPFMPICMEQRQSSSSFNTNDLIETREVCAPSNFSSPSTSFGILQPAVTETNELNGVSSKITRFGGKKINSIQQRCLKIEEKISKEKIPTYKKKVEWQLCNGVYKKKLTLSIVN